MKRISLLILCAVLLSTIQASDLKLRYLRPASDWMNEALPIGNGYMGAMFFGGVITDEIQISEESIWSGGPGSVPQHNYGNKPDSWKYLAQIRNLLTEGKTDEALSLAQKHMTGQQIGRAHV